MRRAALACLLAVCGCASLNAGRAIDDADALIRKARAADADRFAPYQVTTAELYLAKAREQRARAEYSSAEALAKKAAAFAVDAAAQASAARAAPGPEAGKR